MCLNVGRPWGGAGRSLCLMHPPPALWGLQLVSGTGLGSPNQCIQWRRFHDGPCDKGRYREGCTLVYSSVAIYCKACGAFGCSTPSKCAAGLATCHGVGAGIGLVTSPEWAPAVYDIRVSINSHTAIMHNGRKTRKPYRWWLKKYASTNAGGQWASPNVPGSCQLLALHMAGIWPPAR